MTTERNATNEGTAPPPTPPSESGAPGAPPPLPTDGWHYSLAGKQEGPVAAARVAELLSEGKIDGTTMVWRQGWKEWKSLAQTDLAAHLPGTTAASTGGTQPPASTVGGGGLASAFWNAGSDNPVLQWGKVGAVLGALVGAFYFLTERRFGCGDFLLYPILGCAAGVAIRKWIFRTFWS